jgi:AGCS family alanine or glycine:cation symporter
LFGRSKRLQLIYKIQFCLFVVLGATIKLGSVLDFSDAMIFAMMVPNMIGLVLLFPFVQEELKKYLDRIRDIESQA